MLCLLTENKHLVVLVLPREPNSPRLTSLMSVWAGEADTSRKMCFDLLRWLLGNDNLNYKKAGTLSPGHMLQQLQS